MLIVGANLKSLIKQHSIVDNIADSFDNNCITLTLGEEVIDLQPNKEHTTLIYGEDIPKECIKKTNIKNDGLLLTPQKAVLTCSQEVVHIPMGYYGFIQTKGSLARMMVSAHFSDAQIDSGFRGNVTFELFNASGFHILIKKKSPLANLYIFKTSTKKTPSYNGRYNNAQEPTHYIDAEGSC